MCRDYEQKNVVKWEILTTSRQSTILASFSSGSPRSSDTLIEKQIHIHYGCWDCETAKYLLELIVIGQEAGYTLDSQSQGWHIKRRTTIHMHFHTYCTSNFLPQCKDCGRYGENMQYFLMVSN